MPDYNKLTVVKLREELVKRGLQKTGLKPVLVSRLIESDAQIQHANPTTDAQPVEQPAQQVEQVAPNAPPPLVQEQGLDGVDERGLHPTQPETGSAIETALGEENPLPNLEPLETIQKDVIMSVPGVTSRDEASIHAPDAEPALAALENSSVNGAINKELSASHANSVEEIPEKKSVNQPTTEPSLPANKSPLHDSTQASLSGNEILEDSRKRKRRSQSPPPSAVESAQKRAKTDGSRPEVKLPEDMDAEELEGAKAEVAHDTSMTDVAPVQLQEAAQPANGTPMPVEILPAPAVLGASNDQIDTPMLVEILPAPAVLGVSTDRIDSSMLVEILPAPAVLGESTDQINIPESVPPDNHMPEDLKDSQYNNENLSLQAQSEQAPPDTENSPVLPPKKQLPLDTEKTPALPLKEQLPPDTEIIQAPSVNEQSLPAIEKTPALPSIEKLENDSEKPPALPSIEEPKNDSEKTPALPSREELENDNGKTPARPLNEELQPDTEKTPTPPQTEGPTLDIEETSVQLPNGESPGKHSPSGTRFKNLFAGQSKHEASPIIRPSYADQEDRVVSPAVHPATSALYIRDFMRPLHPDNLKEFLIDLATASGATPNPQIITRFFLDPIRTHCLVGFDNMSAASRVRSGLHNRVWPNERSRRPLWVDFVPEEKLKKWIEVELETSSSRGQAGKRWEVVYEEEDDGIKAYLQEAGANSMAPRPAQPHARSEETGQGVRGAPSGPRSRELEPRPSQSGVNLKPDNGKGFQALDDLFQSTDAKPKLYFLPVDKSTINKRLDALDAGRGGGRGDEMRRYTFEDNTIVDRGPEFGARGRGGHGGRGGGGGGGYGSGYYGRGGGYRGDHWRDRR